ncbi:MAG TPA: hypothetical protein DCX06_10560 [Opitutae bacterium]|nr:hypothetical protein [Opitutae bacterium]
MPLVVIFTPALIHLETHRELESIDAMASSNQHNGALIGLAYTDPMHLVKHAVLKNRQPDVIALGTSRVLQFRDFFFLEPNSFYNCGRSVTRIQDLRAFTAAYPGKKPKIIILGLDQISFNVDDEDLSEKVRSYKDKDSSYGIRLTKGTKEFLDTLKDGDLETGSPSPTTEGFIGKNARLHHDGYRADGSYCYGRRMRELSAPSIYEFTNTISRINKGIRKGRGRFAPAQEINKNAIQEFADFLEECKEMNIHVVAFLPPYASKVYDRFKEDSDKYPHIFDLYDYLKPICQAQGMSFFDYSDIRSLGANDFETIDGFHGSEVCYLKLLKQLAINDKILSPYVKESSLDSFMANTFSARQIVKEIAEADPRIPN